MAGLEVTTDQRVPLENMRTVVAGRENELSVLCFTKLGGAADAEGREGGVLGEGGGDEKAMDLFELFEGAVAEKVRNSLLDV